MGSAPSPPPPPNPVLEAQQQTDTNVGTALANSDLQNVNQTDQFGDSITFGQQGTKAINIDGQNFNIPQVTETTQLGPQQQQLFNTTQGAEQNIANDARLLSGQAQQNLANPAQLQGVNLQQLGALPNADLSANNINNYINTSWEQPFNNLAAQEQEQLNQQLASQGILPGGSSGPNSASGGLGGVGNAYQNAQMNLGQELQGQQDTFDNAMFSNATSAILNQAQLADQNLTTQNQVNNQNTVNQANFNNQTALQQQNQPINALSGLLGLSPVQSAAFQQTNQPTIPTTDVAQIDQQAFQDQQQVFQDQLAQSSAANGGLFGLGGSILGGLVKSSPAIPFI